MVLFRYIFWFLFDCCIVNVFIQQKHFKPRTNSSLRQDFKSFRVCLAQGLIGDYYCRQKYSLPVPIHDVTLHNSIPLVKRRRLDDSDAPPTDLDGHFPIKGAKGHCYYCWNIKNRRHKSSILDAGNAGLPCVSSPGTPSHAWPILLQTLSYGMHLIFNLHIHNTAIPTLNYIFLVILILIRCYISHLPNFIP